MKDEANKLARLDWVNLARNFDDLVIRALESKTLIYQEIESKFSEFIEPFSKSFVCKEDLDNLKENVVIRVFNAIAFGKNFALYVVEKRLIKRCLVLPWRSWKERFILCCSLMLVYKEVKVKLLLLSWRKCWLFLKVNIGIKNHKKLNTQLMI